MIFRRFSTKLTSLILLVSVSISNVMAEDLVVETLDETGAKWQQTLKVAKGKSVYFYAWGGSKAVNEYLRWAKREIAKQYGVRLIHVKVTDPGEAVARLKAENGRTSAIDLTWVNGENFAYLKQHDHLLGNLWSSIPNVANLAVDTLPITVDFGESMDGYEVPWGIGQFNLIAEEAVFSNAQFSANDLLTIARNNPETVTYPRPPEFHGSTFLKQLLVNLTKADQRLYLAATQEAQEELLPILWAYLDKLHPYLWQQGKAFPTSSSEQFLLYQQKSLSMAVSFNPNQWIKEKATKQISESSVRRSFIDGAITNSHNLAIPKFAPNSEAAKVVINFMLSEQAQQQKFAGEWGDPSVLKSMFDSRSSLPAHGEPHSSWQLILEDAWQQRYGG
ncbi:ABC transporter substrate-binding protein [Paraglaciecola sp.]|uniref:ABC transporter substrate-binding protein n=3 Tax=Paraglaciecola sp. TaxID=1920173 RepID=UPI00387E64B2